eukprot:2256351-Alexandrium_andersonii.AAC.1
MAEPATAVPPLPTVATAAALQPFRSRHTATRATEAFNIASDSDLDDEELSAGLNAAFLTPSPRARTARLTPPADGVALAAAR